MSIIDIDLIFMVIYAILVSILTALISRVTFQKKLHVLYVFIAFLSLQALYAVLSIIKIFIPAIRPLETGVGFLSLIFIYIFSERLIKDRENPYILAILLVLLGLQVGSTLALVLFPAEENLVLPRTLLEAVISINAAFGLLFSATYFLLRSVEMYRVASKTRMSTYCLMQIIAIIVGFYGTFIYYIFWVLRINPGLPMFLLPLISAVILFWVYYKHPTIVYMLSQKIFGLYVVDKSGTLINGINFEASTANPMLIASLLSAVRDALKEATGIGQTIDYIKFRTEAFIIMEEGQTHDLIALVNRKTPPLIEGLKKISKNIDMYLKQKHVKTGIVTADLLPTGDFASFIRKHLFFIPQIYKESFS